MSGEHAIGSPLISAPFLPWPLLGRPVGDRQVAAQQYLYRQVEGHWELLNLFYPALLLCPDLRYYCTTFGGHEGCITYKFDSPRGSGTLVSSL